MAAQGKDSSEIRDVTLELLRHGPAHNQLLSPLTPYLALCGAEGPVTVQFPFEHRQLLSRLERLRYATSSGDIPAQQREAEVRDMGETVGRVLGQVPGLVSELAAARCDSGMVHLRLSMSAFELAVVPFEFAVSTDGFPASGSPLLLQTQLPITLTREVRRGRPLPVSWNRPPRVLFAFATPAGLPEVPAQEHLVALRKALDPWVPWRANPADRVPELKQLLTVLPNASLDAIRDACAANEYSYVHILAHGLPYEYAGDRHYGLALSNASDPSASDIVDGERLALALTATGTEGQTRHRPTLVSMATCDAGAVDSVLTPAGSIAHALHAGGIPWVVASQFPLWMRASTIATEVLYGGILQGDDPRRVLYELRQRLRTDRAGTHDWASIVAYAAVPWNFAGQVAAFRDRQTRRKLEVRFEVAESYCADADRRLPEEYRDLQQLFDAIRADHARWLAALPKEAGAAQRAEVLGMCAAAEKRIGVFCERAALREQNRDKDNNARAAYKRAAELYKQAMDLNPVDHWAWTQFLSMRAILAEDADALATELGPWWVAARQVALAQEKAAAVADKPWALGTLAELELLAAVYQPQSFDQARAAEHIASLCQQLVEAAGEGSFAARSTRRQFERYVQYPCWRNPRWQLLAEAALAALPADAA